jgi:putative ATP-dependent endonuclease of OLD family
MRIRHVSIQNFRGIRGLDWTIDERLVCLIGPGDAAKSTILDAIALALSSRWGHTFSDVDFFCCELDEPILIRVTVSDLPDELLREDRFGHWQRGVSTDGEVHDEPEDSDEAALTVQLRVDETLEPQWTVVKDAFAGHEQLISATNRARLGAFRMDDAFAMHLRWMNGSALSGLTSAGDPRLLLTRAQRQARHAVFAEPDRELSASAKVAGNLARAAGSAPFDDARPGLDPASGGRGAGLVLHDGAVPATQLGTGSQRLASLAFQMNALEKDTMLLIDEVEMALEPHRLHHLLSVLTRRTIEEHGQVMLTTHSPQVIEAVSVSNLYIVRRADDGTVLVLPVPSDLAEASASEPQAVARAAPSAFLARRIVVCEGKTEVGLLRRLSQVWDLGAETPLALAGTVFVLGGGSEAPRRALAFASLGFSVALIIDDDITGQQRASWEQAVQAASEGGVEIHRWSEGQATEDELVHALPEVGVQELVSLRLNADDDPDSALRSVQACIANELQLTQGTLSGAVIADWATQSAKSLDDVARAIGRVARKKGWFKNETLGGALADLLLQFAETTDPTTKLISVLEDVRTFAYGGPSGTEAGGTVSDIAGGPADAPR